MLREIIQQSIKNGFFDEITEDILNDDEQFNSVVEVFVQEIINNTKTLVELRRKRVIRGKKLKLRVICPKNKRYVASKKQCVRVSGQERIKKKRAMKRAAIKKRGKRVMMKRKRAKSMKKRKAMGLR
jgi:hypothetical protein